MSTSRSISKRGFAVRAKTTWHSINQNVLGVTTSGSEIDQFGAPGAETYTLSAAGEWPARADARVDHVREGRRGRH
ncbi:MAG: hypothetical protein U0165_17350 [Polyangiaceae bacterium]